MKFGLITNLTKPEAVRLAQELCVWGEERGVPFLLYPEEAQVLKQPSLLLERWLSEVDTALVIGGDGTFLKAARMVQNAGISLFGICTGHLGFLAVGDPLRAKEEVLQIERGDFSVEKRRFLQGDLVGADVAKRVFALNDFVLKGSQARLVSIDVQVQGKPMCEYRADGLIVATPTGSTAYALSAGGPIVPPSLDCMELVPICAHTLYARPTLLGPGDCLTLRATEGSELFLTVDGDEVFPLRADEQLQVSLSADHCVSMISLPHFDYYDLLHEKLMWGWNPVTERRGRRA
ncbi:MAG: NAD(+)/NADH kinase [Pyramidobacter sp.]|nr:NAD(+)/NADH kinase [Pyramidobacter sp.]